MYIPEFTELEKKEHDKILKWFLYYAIVGVVFCLLTGCNPEKKINKAVATLKKYDRLDDTCASNFPVIDKVVVRSDTLTDTLYVEPPTAYDTIYKDGEVVYLKQDCPPSKVITRTIKKDSIIFRRDVAYENVLNDKMDGLSKANKEMDIKLRATEAQNKMLSDRVKGKILIPWWWILILGAAIGAAIRFKAIKFLNPLK